MNKIQIEDLNDVDVDEFIKSISYISSLIVSVEKKGMGIEVEISDEGELEKIKEQLLNHMKKYKKDDDNQIIIFSSNVKKTVYFNIETNDSELKFWGNGQVSFSQKGKILMDIFDDFFRDIAISLGAEEKLYPALIPVRKYSKTGYLKKTPQYAIFCGCVKDDLTLIDSTDNAVHHGTVHKIIKEPEFALSPSACFHTYIEYSGQELSNNTVITFKQNVFRNEGRLNYNEIGRLCDYHVREIVMIGSDEFTISCRDRIIEKVVEIMECWGIEGDISLASDSFVMPKMQVYRKIQRIDKSKYEMHMNVAEKKVISTASFNLHGKAFTDPFNIKVKGVDNTVTGCVGFGLQRWIIAFFCQYGFDEGNWPYSIREKYSLYLNKGR